MGVKFWPAVPEAMNSSVLIAFAPSESAGGFERSFVRGRLRLRPRARAGLSRTRQRPIRLQPAGMFATRKHCVNSFQRPIPLIRTISSLATPEITGCGRQRVWRFERSGGKFELIASVAPVSSQWNGTSFFWLEHFDEIAGRINNPNLRTARPAYDVVATELHASSAKSLRFGFDVGDHQ